MNLRYSEAINLAMQEAMIEDPRVILMGEEVASPQGGAFAVTRQLSDLFGTDRVIDTPISENSFVGVAVGAAVSGFRPIVELMFADFIALAADQLINHAAKFHYMYGGQVKVPMVLRTACGGYRGYGATHSQFPAAWFMNIPGLKILAPFTPADARWMLRWAIRDDNPVIFLEHKLLYSVSGQVPDLVEIPDSVTSSVIRKGKDVTIVGFSYVLGMALEAADQLSELGISAEVIDIRSIKPLDLEVLLTSIKTTGKAVIIEEGPKTGGVGAEIVAGIVDQALTYLDGRLIRVAGFDTPIPSSLDLEKAVLPDTARVVSACLEAMEYD